MFRVWGYPDHFYLVIGAVEAVCGLALLVPRLATPAALSLMIVMAGAAVTQLTHGRNGVGELVLFTVLGIVAFARRGSSWFTVHGSTFTVHQFTVPGNLERSTENREP